MTPAGRRALAAAEVLFGRHGRWAVLTGAGLSAASGIPTYRDDFGTWQRSRPIQHQEFIGDETARRRYWSRSLVGWRHVARSRPNEAHHALARLEAAGRVTTVITQNVDRLHQAAGHRRVIDLHGRLDRVRCLDCGAFSPREGLQGRMERDHPGLGQVDDAELRPDGDAEPASDLAAAFRVPACEACAGVLMPDVVFFGGQVPRPRVERARAAVARADGLMVVGSSLMVYSGFRFCREARELGKPLLIINRGRTRADDLATLKVEADCAEALARLADRIGGPAP